MAYLQNWRAHGAVLVVIGFCLFGMARTVTQLVAKHTPEIESTYALYYDGRFAALRGLSSPSRFGFMCIEDDAPSMDCLRDYFLAQYELAPRLVDFQPRDVTIAESDRHHDTVKLQRQQGYTCLRELSSKYSVVLFRNSCPEIPIVPKIMR